MPARKKSSNEILEIQEIKMKELRFNILGHSPMIMNRQPWKLRCEMLLPPRDENRAARNARLKHDPESEYRGAVYLNRDNKRAAAIHVPTGAFHGAIAAVALDIPGAKKAQIERLTRVVDVTIDLFGIPKLYMAMVRNSDMNHTPDLRTRPIFPEWACTVTVSYMQSVLNDKTIVNLLGAAGQIIGIGDWRGQKGGPYGSFRVVPADDATFKDIVKNQGREPQMNALKTPVCYDADTEELMAWFMAEIRDRELTDKLNKVFPQWDGKTTLESRLGGNYEGVAVA